MFPQLLAAAAVTDNCDMFKSLLANQHQHLALFNRAKEMTVLGNSRGVCDGSNTSDMASGTSLLLSHAVPVPVSLRTVPQPQIGGHLRLQVRPTAPTAIIPTTSSTTTTSTLFMFKCPLCSLVYRTQAFLNEHMRNEHSILI